MYIYTYIHTYIQACIHTTHTYIHAYMSSMQYKVEGEFITYFTAQLCEVFVKIEEKKFIIANCSTQISVLIGTS